MTCEYCRKIPHDNRCPNAPLPQPRCTCSLCKEGIYDGEEYFESENGDIAHWECIEDITKREFIKWMGYKVKTMKGEDDGY